MAMMKQTDSETDDSMTNHETNEKFNTIKDIISNFVLSENQYKEISDLCQKKINEIENKKHVKNVTKEISKINVDKLLQSNNICENDLIRYEQNIRRFLDGMSITKVFTIKDLDCSAKSYYIYFQFETHKVELGYKIKYIEDVDVKIDCSIVVDPEIIKNTKKRKRIKIAKLISILNLDISEGLLCEMFDIMYRGFRVDDFEYYCWVDYC